MLMSVATYMGKVFWVVLIRLEGKNLGRLPKLGGDGNGNIGVIISVELCGRFLLWPSPQSQLNNLIRNNLLWLLLGSKWSNYIISPTSLLFLLWAERGLHNKEWKKLWNEHHQVLGKARFGRKKKHFKSKIWSTVTTTIYPLAAQSNFYVCVCGSNGIIVWILDECINLQNNIKPYYAFVRVFLALISLVLYKLFILWGGLKRQFFGSKKMDELRGVNE